jgi:hypothetical protein
MFCLCGLPFLVFSSHWQSLLFLSILIPYTWQVQLTWVLHALHTALGTALRTALHPCERNSNSMKSCKDRPSEHARPAWSGFELSSHGLEF